SSGLPRATDLAHLARGRDRAFDHRAVGDQVGPNALEPVPQRTSGEAVVTVVARNGISECISDRLRVADLEKDLDGRHRLTRVLERCGPGERESTLELLD